MQFLETDRLLFRTHEPSDEADFVAMHTDPEVRRYVGGQAWPLDRALDRFRNAYLGKPEETYGLWATICKENDRYIGSCGLAMYQNGPHLGYYIAQHYWGRGFASEAAAAFVEYGFARLRLPRIFADVERGHRASERILEKLGFGLVRQEVVGEHSRIICHYEMLLPPTQC